MPRDQLKQQGGLRGRREGEVGHSVVGNRGGVGVGVGDGLKGAA